MVDAFEKKEESDGVVVVSFVSLFFDDKLGVFLDWKVFWFESFCGAEEAL